MSPHRRNILVGVVVLTALVFLGWMILKFGGAPARLFAQPSMPVQFVAQRADGVADGSPILYLGVNVGRVVKVERTSMTEIVIDAHIDLHPPLPANVEGVIVAQSLLGAGSAISLQVINGKPAGQLTEGARINARFAGLEILPPQFAELAQELQKTARQFRESKIIEHVDQEVQRAGQLIESVRTLVADDEMRADLRVTLENIRTATETTNQIAENLEELTTKAISTADQAQETIAKTEVQIVELSQKVGDRLVQLAKLLETFQSISSKIDDGKGTAGQLVNDKRLYDSLVNTSQELNATIIDLKRLIQQWEEEGMVGF